MAWAELSVGPSSADVCGADNRAIQTAVDRVAALGGGRVILRPGTYHMEDALHLRTGVHVEGSGRETVLRKAAEVRSDLSADLGYGHYDVSLAEPDKFRVGMGVLIGDSRSGGFYETQATLTWRDGDRFGLSHMLNHDYGRYAKGRVVSLFPVVRGEGVHGASVANLAVDGNRAQNPDTLNGCRGGGVFLIQCRQVTLRGLHVANVNGDGISFQQTDGTRIEDCTCEDNAGLGLHPGSGSVRPVLLRCTCRRNGADGIFYCLRVSFSLCEGCLVEENGRHGISVGGRDTDHLIRRNTIRHNGGCGIFFREHDRVMAGNRCHVEENDVAGNCQSSGEAEVHLAAALADVHVLRNRIQPASRRIAGIRVAEGTEGVVIYGNQIGGEAATAMVIEGDPAAVRLGPPEKALAVGPDNAPPDAARHLRAGV
ncbi:MAG TPA: right-handed parallel beta-helix repeat-containing protein [Planctomycetota bacterium]|nr:right-handed parallel beta-helix repeat-containing protein [Planctomycetota bacterium]HRR80346.1 right-handed parallel beta-helix repeat-containing protein [Planctomycetota bacterium]HRT97396.1 right-handed parallel beta-helix repeat-containing protein [Planctomycetota bacterium]